MASSLNVSPTDTMAVGNDYNDVDLLEWAAHGFIVDNAPDDLKCRFQQVGSNNNGGVAEAVNRWRESRSVGWAGAWGESDRMTLKFVKPAK